MSLLIISGSQRSGSESVRVARFVQRAWAGVHANDQTPAAVIDLTEMRASWWYDEGGTATPEQTPQKRRQRSAPDWFA